MYIASCLYKDFIEFIRTKKNILYCFTLFSLIVYLLGVTVSYPIVLKRLNSQYPNIISDITSFYKLFDKMFPSDLKSSMGVFASVINIFYLITVLLCSYDILPSEIREKKWILPINTGYKPTHFIFSKCTVYSLFAAFPVIIIFNLYYIIASFFLKNNIQYTVVLINSFLQGFVIFSSVMIVMLLSVLLKHSVFGALTVITTVIAGTDFFSYFPFEKYLPTYLLTSIYSMNNEPIVIISMVEIILIIGVLIFLVLRKKA